MMNSCLRAPVMMSLIVLISIALMAATPAAPEALDKTKERSCTGDVPSWYCEAPKGSSAASGDSRAEALAWVLRELAAHQQALMKRLMAEYAQPSKEEKTSTGTDQFVCGFKVKGMIKHYKADPEPGTTKHKEELATIVTSVQLVQNKFKTTKDGSFDIKLYANEGADPKRGEWFEKNISVSATNHSIHTALEHASASGCKVKHTFAGGQHYLMLTL